MLTVISSIPVVVPQLIWNAYSSSSSILFTDLLTPFQQSSPFVLARVGLLKSAFVLPLLQNEPFVVVITRCWSGRTTAISSVMTLTSSSETGLASWTFAAADENTPWLSSKKFTQSFDSSIFLDYISVAFIARSIRWTSSNFGSYPLSSNFLLNPDDLHLSMTWSQSFSVRLLPKLQFSAWCVNLITNWSTLSLFSCFIWQKMCLSYWMFAFGEKCSSNTFEAASHSYIPSLASIL